MRGVYLPEGSHTVEFKFKPSTRPLWVSCAALGVGALLLIMFIALPADRSPRPARERKEEPEQK
jgi:hypothetical protein